MSKSVLVSVRIDVNTFPFAFGSSQFLQRQWLLMRGPHWRLHFCYFPTVRGAEGIGWVCSDCLWSTSEGGAKAGMQPKQVLPKHNLSAARDIQKRAQDGRNKTWFFLAIAIVLQKKWPQKQIRRSPGRSRRTAGRKQSALCTSERSSARRARQVQDSPGWKSFERAKRRLTCTEAVIARAHEQKSIFKSQLGDVEARLVQLQAEFEAWSQWVRQSPSCNAKSTSCFRNAMR